MAPVPSESSSSGKREGEMPKPQSGGELGLQLPATGHDLQGSGERNHRVRLRPAGPLVGDQMLLLIPFE